MACGGMEEQGKREEKRPSHDGELGKRRKGMRRLWEEESRNVLYESGRMEICTFC